MWNRANGSVLQWSHAFSNVEIKSGRRMSAAARQASMEPRFFKRGNPPDAIADEIPSAELQWSHAFSNVEIILKFQNLKGHFLASMEPRFFKRGNVPETVVGKDLN